MVEYMIGKRTGTGGSSGVDYLDETGKLRLFRFLNAEREYKFPQQLSQ